MSTPGTESGFVDSWQRGKSVIECNLHMLETEDFTDVTFLVGSEKQVVRAHRYVLASRSCVFHAMLCGRMAEQGEITIPDIEVNVFKEFLRFIYTDSVTINSDNVAGLLYTSRKYDVQTLHARALSFLDISLTEEKLCEILEKSHGYFGFDLEEEAMEMLSQAGSNVIKSAGFLELCPECFESFLKSEKLDLKEIEVFEATLSWSIAKCQREGLSPSHENMRKVLGEMVYEIRFASLSLEYLTKEVGPSGLLTSDERLKIIDRILDRNTCIAPFKTERRRDKTKSNFSTWLDLKHIYVQRFNTILPPSNQSGWHAISFTSNMSITLLGCQLYGSDTQSTTRLHLQLFDDQRNLISHPIQNTNWSLRDSINDVMCPDPVPIEAGRLYTIIVGFSGPIRCCSGSEGQRSVIVNGVEFTFKRNREWSSITSVRTGQLPGLIWQY